MKSKVLVKACLEHDKRGLDGKGWGLGERPETPSKVKEGGINQSNQTKRDAFEVNIWMGRSGGRDDSMSDPWTRKVTPLKAWDRTCC